MKNIYFKLKFLTTSIIDSNKKKIHVITYNYYKDKFCLSNKNKNNIDIVLNFNI